MSNYILFLEFLNQRNYDCVGDTQQALVKFPHISRHAMTAENSHVKKTTLSRQL